MVTGPYFAGVDCAGLDSTCTTFTQTLPSPQPSPAILSPVPTSPHDPQPKSFTRLPPLHPAISLSSLIPSSARLPNPFLILPFFSTLLNGPPPVPKISSCSQPFLTHRSLPQHSSQPPPFLNPFPLVPYPPIQ
jgi:hypothetical protein